MPVTKTQIARSAGAACLVALLSAPLPAADDADDRCAPLAALVAWSDHPPALSAEERARLARQIQADSLFLGLSDALLARLQQGLHAPDAPADPLSATDRDRLRHLLHLCQASAWGASTAAERPPQVGFDLPGNWPKLLALVLLGSAGIALLLRRDRRARHQKRREARILCRIPSRYSRASGPEFPTMIGDISRMGCRIRNSGGGLKAGEALTVSLHGRAIPARVQWCNSHYVGLRFEHSLSDEELAGIAARPERLSEA